MFFRRLLWVSLITVIAIPVAVPAAASATTIPPHVVSGPFIIRDVIAITADTRRVRDRIMEYQIKPHWKVALGPEIASFNLVVKGDLTYASPSTPDGNAIRQITYDIAGISPGPLDTTATLNKFHDLARAAGVRDLWAIQDKYGNMVLASTSPRNQTAVVTTCAAPVTQNAAVAVGILALSNSTARVPTTREPVIVHGEFLLPDSLAIVADTRRQRDRILNDEIKPIWRKAFGRNVTAAISFTVKCDTTFSPPSTPDGKSIRRIDYSVDGVSTIDLNFSEHRDLFHVLALNARLSSLWAVPDPYGNWVLASSVPLKTTTTTVLPPTTTVNARGSAFTPIIIPVGPEQPTTTATVQGTTRTPLSVCSRQIY